MSSEAGGVFKLVTFFLLSILKNRSFWAKFREIALKLAYLLQIDYVERVNRNLGRVKFLIWVRCLKIPAETLVTYFGESSAEFVVCASKVKGKNLKNR